jgi:hypothetical protein
LLAGWFRGRGPAVGLIVPAAEATVSQFELVRHKLTWFRRSRIDWRQQRGPVSGNSPMIGNNVKKAGSELPDMGQSTGRCLAHYARDRPTAIAAVHGDVRVTYRSLVAHVL